jgi:hypothetical protein
MNPIIFFSNEENKDITFRIFSLLNLKQYKTLALINKKMNHMIKKKSINSMIFFSNKENKDISFRIFCLLNLKQCKILACLNKKINYIITNIMYQLFADFFSSINEYEITETQIKKFRWIIKWLHMKNIITLENITEKYLGYDSALFKPITERDEKFKKYLSMDYYYCDIILPLVLNTNDEPASEAGKLIVLDRSRDSIFKPIKDMCIETISKTNDTRQACHGSPVAGLTIFIENDKLYKKINSFFLYDNYDHIFLWAARCGYLDVVQYFIFKTQIKIDSHRFGSAAVEYASQLGHLKIVQYLISAGVNPKANNNKPIKLACEAGKLEVVKYLVSCNVDFNCEYYYPLRTAHKNNHVKVVDYLKSLGEQYIDEALISASKENDLDIIKLLISLSKKPKIIDAFCTAYNEGFYNVIKYLKKLIHDISPLSHSLVPSWDIKSSIVCASKCDNINILKTLMTAYANYINHEEIIKEILPHALSNNQFKIIEYLISIIFLPLVSHTYEQVYKKNINCTDVNIVHIRSVLDGYYISFITPLVEFTKEHHIYFSSEKITVIYPYILYMYKLKNYIPLVEDSKFVPFEENNALYENNL